MDINYNIDHTIAKNEIRSAILTYGYNTYMRFVEEVVCDLKMILQELPKDDVHADTTKEIMIAANVTQQKQQQQQKAAADEKMISPPQQQPVLVKKKLKKAAAAGQAHGL